MRMMSLLFFLAVPMAVHAASVKDRIAAIDEADKIASIEVYVASWQHLQEPSIDGNVDGIRRHPEFKLATSDLQHIVDVVSILLSGRSDRCSISVSQFLEALVVLRFKTGSEAEFFVTDGKLDDFRNKRCFAEPAWVAKAIAL